MTTSTPGRLLCFLKAGESREMHLRSKQAAWLCCEDAGSK